MPTTRISKWQRKKKPVCNKFPAATEKTREQTEEFWDKLALPKKTRIQTDKQYSKACREVDERDKHTCRHPGCNCRVTQHHHAKYRGQGGKDDVRNLVSLCWRHHVGSNECPHQSEKWRDYWVEWLTEMYPDFWRGVRESQKIKQRGCANG